VTETRDGVGDWLKWRDHHPPLLDGRSETIRRPLPACRLVRLLGADGPFVDGVSQHDHVARGADGLDECRVRFGASHLHRANLVSRDSVLLENGQIDRDDLRPAALEEVDQDAENDARPRPSAEVRRQIANGGVVDFDEDDVLADRSGVGRLAHAPVVGLQLRRIERARRAEQQGDRRGAQTEQKTGNDLSHPVAVVTPYSRRGAAAP